jgi:hypothetical protein
MAAGAAEHNMIARAFLSVYAKKNGIAVDMPPPAALKLPYMPPLIDLSSESDSDDSSKTPAKTVATGGVDVDLEAVTTTTMTMTITMTMTMTTTKWATTYRRETSSREMSTRLRSTNKHDLERSKTASAS